MIESTEIAAMTNEKDEMLPDCYHSDGFEEYGLPVCKQRLAGLITIFILNKADSGNAHLHQTLCIS
jgi:hypothetical protein